MFLELIRRLDPRITWADIIMRMEPDVLPRTALGDRRLKNRMQNANTRLHYPLHYMVSWWVKGEDKKPMKERIKVLAALTEEQIQQNTTRGASPGIIDLALPDTPANRVPAVEYNSWQGKVSRERGLYKGGPGFGPFSRSTHYGAFKAKQIAREKVEGGFGAKYAPY